MPQYKCVSKSQQITAVLKVTAHKWSRSTSFDRCTLLAT